MLFGMNHATDVDSLITYLAHFGHERLTTALVPRMNTQEIHQVVDLLTQIMRNHLTDEEYHALFLGEPHHH